MMQKFVENTGTSPMYVGNVMIPPGEGKIVDVPDEAVAAPPAVPAGPTLLELVTELLAKSVAKITAELPHLKHEALDLLEETERAAERPRTTLLAAVEAERLDRANRALLEEKGDTLALAELDLLAAQNTLADLAADATDEARAAAQQAVDDAQAKVQALREAAPNDDAAKA